MQYEKKFFTFRRFNRRTTQSTNSRLDTLFEQCGLADRLLTGEEAISDCINLEIDYADVHRRIDRLRQYSWDYLIRALEDSSQTDLL